MPVRLRHILLFFALTTATTAWPQINYAHFIQKARLDLTEGRYKESLSELNTAIAARPDNFEGYFLRGLAKYSLDDLQGAIFDFDKTLEIHPMYVRALQYRAICYDKQDDSKKALDDLNRANQLDPFDADVLFTRGITYLHLGDYAKAIADYDMVLSIEKDDALAYVNRGVAKSHLKQYQSALDDLDKAVALDFLNPEVFYHRGLVRMQCDSFAQALDDLNEAIRLDERNPLFYFNRAVAETNLHDTIAALRDYAMVNQLDERNALTYFNRGILYASQKNYADALEMFDLVTLINPNNIYGYFNRAIVYYEQKRWKAAEADLTKVIELFPEYISAWVNRSMVREKSGDKRGAYTDHKQALHLIKVYNGNSADSDVLFQKYADSTYFKHIMAFESDFINGETKESQVQYADVDIHLFPNFVVAFVTTEEEMDGQGIYFGDRLPQVNEAIAGKLMVCRDDKPRGDITTWLTTNHLGDYAMLNRSAMMFNKEQEQRLEGKRDPDHTPIVDLLHDMLKTNRSNPFLWYNLGNIHLHQKDYNRAIDAFSEALALNPNLAEAYYNRALTLIFIKETKLALADLSKAGELGLTEAYAVMKRFGRQHQ